jgi:hypothetical protein
MEVNTVDIPIKQAAVMLLDNAGYKNDEIAKALDIHKTYPSQIKNKLKSTWDMVSQKRVKAAVQLHDRILSVGLGKLPPDSIPFALKGSDVNTRIDSVIDRASPKVQHNLNINLDVDIDPVDLDRFKR